MSMTSASNGLWLMCAERPLQKKFISYLASMKVYYLRLMAP